MRLENFLRSIWKSGEIGDEGSWNYSWKHDQLELQSTDA